VTLQARNLLSQESPDDRYSTVTAITTSPNELSKVVDLRHLRSSEHLLRSCSIAAAKTFAQPETAVNDHE
jgi:hypothetical protein